MGRKSKREEVLKYLDSFPKGQDLSKHRFIIANTIAKIIHKNQKDLSGEPYLNHIWRVLDNCRSLACHLHNDIYKDVEILALLHDSVEDSDLTIEDLKPFFSEKIITGLDNITKRPLEKYNSYLERVLSLDISFICKMGDLQDNMNITRLKKLKQRDIERLVKYHKAYIKILKCYEKL